MGEQGLSRRTILQATGAATAAWILRDLPVRADSGNGDVLQAASMMVSRYRVQRISGGDKPSIHSYFDLCPESPDGKWVLYYCWDNVVPGPGQLILARRDGSAARSIGRSSFGNAHVSLRQMWIDNETVAFARPAGDGVEMVVLNIVTGNERIIPGAMRAYCQATGMGIYATQDYRNFRKRAPETAVYALDVKTGQSRQLLSLEQAIAAHPLREKIKPAAMEFKHTKWSPDGRLFFGMFNNVGAEKRDPETSGGLIKSLMIGDADGSNIRYFKEAGGGHPMWTADSVAIYDYYTIDGGVKASVRRSLNGEEAILHRGPGVHGSLCPDGNTFLTDAFDFPTAGMGSILRYRIGGDKPEVLAVFRCRDRSHGTGCHPHAAWSADGQRIYFNSDDSGQAALYVLDLTQRLQD